MKKLKEFNFSYLSIGILSCSVLIITLLNFLDILSVKVSNILIFIIFFILLILNSFKIALKSKDKGIITGTKIASIITIIIVTLKLLFKIKFNFYTAIYILLIYLLSIIPSIYASNKKGANLKNY